MNDYRIIPSIALLCLLAMPIQQSVAQEAAGQDTEVATLEEVVVVGSRVPTRSAHDSPVPIDVIDGSSLRNYGVRDLNSLLRATVPSYNVSQQPLSDAATLVRPANLRGLPPDSTLILVNGKRRHRSSIITFLGGGLSNGSHAPDIAAIPAIALKRVEVLRDGAAAQYGSDAIAGVINFQLKDAPDSARWKPAGASIMRETATPAVLRPTWACHWISRSSNPDLPISASNMEHQPRPSAPTITPRRGILLPRAKRPG